jgi:hypothetical protein
MSFSPALVFDMLANVYNSKGIQGEFLMTENVTTNTIN